MVSGKGIVIAGRNVRITVRVARRAGNVERSPGFFAWDRNFRVVSGVHPAVKRCIQAARIVCCVILVGTPLGGAQEHADSGHPAIPCASGERPYRDFDFILGTWEFRTPEGVKVGEQVITRRGGGCAIVEEWTEISGLSGVGVSFVDPATGLWRQVWVSSRFRIDYSGGLDEDGTMVLEGTMHPTHGDGSSRVRGLWSRQADGTLKKEFQRFDEREMRWTTFFSGFAIPRPAKHD